MDGLSRALGTGPTITLCGQTFSVQGRLIRHYAEIEAQMIKERPDPFQLMREGVSAFQDNPEGMRFFVRECYDIAKTWKSVAGHEIRDWLNTFKGNCFAVWLCIRHNNPEYLTLEKVTELMLDDAEKIAREKGEAARAAKQAEIERAIDQASGTDTLGN